MIEQFKNIKPNLGVTRFKDPELNLEPSLYKLIYNYYREQFEEEKATHLTNKYIQKWVEESFKESFW